jgi:hypothetical protein
MGGTWGAWKIFTKLCVICVRSVGCLIHSFDQQYRVACGLFIVKLNLDTIIVQVVVWARIYNLKCSATCIHYVCLLLTLICTYLHLLAHLRFV